WLPLHSRTLKETARRRPSRLQSFLVLVIVMSPVPDRRLPAAIRHIPISPGASLPQPGRHTSPSGAARPGRRMPTPVQSILAPGQTIAGLMIGEADEPRRKAACPAAARLKRRAALRYLGDARV